MGLIGTKSIPSMKMIEHLWSSHTRAKAKNGFCTKLPVMSQAKSFFAWCGR